MTPDPRGTQAKNGLESIDEYDSRSGRAPPQDGASVADAGALHPLPGEAGIPDVAQRRRGQWSKKGLLTAGLLVGTVIVVAGATIHRLAATGKKADPTVGLVGNRPVAATGEPRKLDLQTPSATSTPAVATTSTTAAATPRVPAIEAMPDEPATPIGVRRTAGASPTRGVTKVAPPEDAPVLLVTTRVGQPPARSTSNIAAGASSDADHVDPSDALGATARNLQGYQRQLQGMLDSLTRVTSPAGEQGAAPLPGGPLVGGPASMGNATAAGLPAGAGLFGGQLQAPATPRTVASTLGSRSLTLPKGTAFTCALKTRVISAMSGLVGCQVQRNVFSDDGRVLLIERGSHLDGEYRIMSVRPGMVRIPVLWTRIRTPLGVTVDVESPGTGQLGEGGIDGHVDNRWGERIGAAMLLSLIDDAVKLTAQQQANDRQADTIVLPSSTANTSKLAEKVLDSTINIPPLIYQNQGGIVGIYVARDVDFSSVYELRPVADSASTRGTP